MMTLARKPSKASFPQATQTTLLRVKARLQAHQDWAASTSRLGCKHAKTGLQARPVGKRSFPHPETEHAAQARAARSTSHRSTLHQPSHRAASVIAPQWARRGRKEDEAPYCRKTLKRKPPPGNGRRL